MSVSPEWLEFLREQFPKGSRIELKQQDSNTSYQLPVGSKGTLDCIDDSGVFDVQWDSGEYTGTSTSRYATGYTVTANYVGRVSKTGCNMITYTAIFGGVELPAKAEPEPTPEPMPALSAKEASAADTGSDVTETPAPEQAETAPAQEKQSVAWIPVCLIVVACAGLGVAWYVRTKKGGAHSK